MKNIVYLVISRSAYNGAPLEAIRTYCRKAVDMILECFNVPISHIEYMSTIPEIKKGGKEWTKGDKIFCRADSDEWLCLCVNLAQDMIEAKFRNSIYAQRPAGGGVE